MTDYEAAIEQAEKKTEQRRASIHVGGRTYSEVIDMAEVREHYDEAEFSRRKPTWERYTRPVTVKADKVESLAGNHFLFGWVEGIHQSDSSPIFALEEGNNPKAKWFYQFG